MGETNFMTSGPSPRVQGAAVEEDIELALVGTIPARAGSSLRDLQFYPTNNVV